ncbi:ribosome silencing factor [Vagococcus intermedius]|uniref:Ribosomal silencing factor RsfS n=1 Tax=Vagococcus intermedius TaxID=2991418 RepID=A0AAF0CWT6_9ENTE|nr:ribosome silencing factor [Vagococcus intermedius]WEG74329.1 ribosome silencing factor [Vagococcus intermedius]WEG76411.1 ribosome silencing factor [Vagococcus intermedius]
MESSQLLEVVVKAADDKRAEEIIAMDVQGISLLADYFVVCHGNSEKQVGAIVDQVAEAARENGIEVGRIEGKESGKWVLVDLGDIVLHVFHAEERSFYNLEKLWADAPTVNIASMID